MTLLKIVSASSRRFLTFGTGNLQKYISDSSCNVCATFGGSITQDKLFIKGWSRQFHTSPRVEDSFKIQDEQDFNNRVLKNQKPVVVQFHASWCGPCKMLSPRMEKAVALTKDAVDLAQVDIDDNPELAMSYSVGAVPAVMAVKDGKVVDKFVGLKDEDQLDSFIAKLVKC
ncbi:Thioredoxin, mitochondrial [Orchesella cincta]|uniref:Thioredoxin, mitochondrial n=1 Tax=Orchesella cincta TaxID=48709 RepID=A0A1D2MPH7_ORCCI|nr:Thioredoxin, mitochondrial [Orchesella cincta]